MSKNDVTLITKKIQVFHQEINIVNVLVQLRGKEKLSMQRFLLTNEHSCSPSHLTHPPCYFINISV